MNSIHFDTLDEVTISVKVPENLSELTFRQLMQLRDPDATEIEQLAALTGYPVAVFYNAANMDSLIESAKPHLGIFAHNAETADLNTLPRRIKVKYQHKVKTIRLPRKRLSVEPIGAYYRAKGRIEAEVNAMIELYGEYQWRGKFAPSLETCGEIVNTYLYCHVTGLPWQEFTNLHFNVAADMAALDVLRIAKHIFNSYPDLYERKAGFFIRFKRVFNAELLRQKIKLRYADQRN